MNGDATPDTDPHRERAERILDAAGELMLRLGYRRVTIEDVATAAGVGKGTVYLHWKNRQALFLDVLQREAIASVDDLVGAIRADPETVRLHRLAASQFSNVLNRPLLRALYTEDPEVLGKLAKGLYAMQDPAHHAAFDAYLRLLSENGLLFGSFDVTQISSAFHAILHGFLTEAPGEVSLLAATLRRAYEPTSPQPVTPAVAAEAARLFADSADGDRARLHRAFHQSTK